ncbi:dTDP-4-dehydrorhamnose reductase [Zymomonas mobilis]|uniref:dTDP-4-dehydrorhamnose reductase n=1 Tax=Zymomonas mobilis subsp. mobilis (strain ATCC 10988 / DSM 424 / LMG 404 / NCIMB 8938 / NRRL B-806 / ZM1) TaxID=555217 RepID=A0A0H3G4B5_ZYMMA|nr:dTDP-4-dehydrorhamnose reductase [Zymomonas mobilis]AEH63470.1 dTDP-4-dehydrorhamnose reductase [Zymomonas mobilis subsp. mobilis ATCC 10988]ART94320.1 NAD(P)-dependent oxidoreductase [Zymomonas mobilis subsp. mobilis]TQL26916.1 LOW QUALITY PROTEIN: dTDP-4-dehydrorhamnose reductase [Zymomonas mobilis]TQL30562.1 dTDP-4-dehydrorhamnose reductase [Zymomonas mobilis]TWD60818.1 dTDP-4-dehydrorhamnose reductase [Zymomonas mobilis]
MISNFENSILVIGRNGQLATSLSKLGKESITCIGRPILDFNYLDSILEIIKRHKPRIIINTAAWTAVDLAEKQKKAAMQINYLGAKELAHVCNNIQIPLIHISTDYVYDGKKGSPYIETDPIKPQTVYGRSKAAGELAVLSENPNSIILRTSWVYSSCGENFVCKIINASKKQSSLKVVADQYGNPTNSDDLANAIIHIIPQIFYKSPKKCQGIYNVSGTGSASWYEFAKIILEESKNYGLLLPKLTPIFTSDWPTLAKRPKNSCLDCKKFKDIFGIRLPYWRSSIKKTISEIFNKN